MIAGPRRRHPCGHGRPHRLMPPIARTRKDDAGESVVVGATCADCGTLFLSPTLFLPTRYMIRYRRQRLAKEYLFRRGCAWIAHEAGRP